MKEKTTNRFRVWAIIASLWVIPAVANASIMGELFTGGQAVISGTGAAAKITFTPFAPPLCAGSNYDIVGGTGFFTPPIAGSTGCGTIMNLTAVVEPIDTIISVLNFMTFAGVPNLTFELTEILGGVDGTAQCLSAPAPGQICSPPGTPFNLSNASAATSGAQFVVLGNFHAPDGSVTPAKGIFTAANVTGSFQDLLATVNGGGSVPVAYGADFVTVPEPNVGLLSGLIGVGFLAIGLVGSRRIRKS